MQALHDLAGLRMQRSLDGCMVEDNYLIAKVVISCWRSMAPVSCRAW